MSPMSEAKIKSLEKICLENIKSSSYDEFELNFNLYSTFKGKSSYLKAYMLLLLLSQNRKIDYYKLVESISYEELEDENIKMVLFIERCTNTGNLGKLESMKKESRFSEFKEMIGKIIELNRTYSESLTKKTVENHIPQSQTEHHIKTALHISLNSHGF